MHRTNARSRPTLGLAESPRYVVACHRYIELNPVRAGMVDHPSGYPWSSYALNSGMRSDTLVMPHPDVEALGGDPVSRYAAYRGLFEERLDPVLMQNIREATNAGYPLASDAFKANVLEPLGWKMEPGKPGPRMLSPTAVYGVAS